ncbi:MAG TPA: hypothetical protein VJY35_02095 [Candidatus Eisenbacteria bacterium]|nr:hypothetical protein [Candidatus Eisenbacteria bacterium]
MARLRRLGFLLVPVALGIISAALPGRAQEGSSSRFAFSDTTLLRDTLNLTFTRLFPLADSLQLPPDTLRALSIRYLWSLERMIQLADSLGMPVDSVGPVLMRERFNPLAAGAATRNDFSYNSSYTIAQTQSAWRNAADYSFRTGPVFVQNSTTVQMDRYRAGRTTSLRQTRGSATEIGWRFSPDFSVGGRVNLERFDSLDPASTSNIGETKNEYQMSVRSRPKLLKGMTSSINMFAGMLDLQNASLEKRGLSGNLNGRIRFAAGNWLSQEVNGTVDGNLSRTRVPTDPETQNTRDYSQNIRGILNLFQSSWISLKGNFNYRHVQVETPDDSTSIRRVLSDGSGADATVRLRMDNDRYIDLSERVGVTKQATVLGARSRTTRRDDSFNATGRYLLWGWALDGRFSHGFGNSAFPTRSDSGGYSEFLHQRSLDGVLSKQLTRRVLGQFSAAISLSSFRYAVIGKYPTLPVSRDQLRQSWRAKMNYAHSQRFGTSLSMDVGRNRLINIPAASAGTNSNTRSYRSEWSWTYQLLPGLTATQINTISADYLSYPFLPDNNRLTLDYNAVTTMNAVITPRLNVSLTHNARQTPGGNYTAYPDGLYYFSRAEESTSYSLRASINYAPSEAITFSFRPSYFTTDRSGAVNAVQVPQRASRTLDFSGGSSINWNIAKKGSLRGDISRTYRADRTTTYSSGVPNFSPRSEIDYWNGSLQLSWHL